MATKRRSPLDPGAYGKPQRWHEVLTAGAEERAVKRAEVRRRNEEAAQNTMLSSIVNLFS